MKNLLRKSTVYLLAILIAVASSSTQPVAAIGDGFEFQTRERAPLQDSRTYIVHGSKIEGGCAYQYPRTVTPRGHVAWEVRTVGVDMKQCRKLMQEGVPTDLSSPAGDSREVQVFGSTSRTGRAPGQARPLAATLSGHTESWFEDCCGILLNKDRTEVTWSFNGECATGGSTSGFWEWNSGSGWRLISNGGSNNTYCLYHRGDTWSEFRNGLFCSPLTVYTYYWHVIFNGYYDGTWSGYVDHDTAYECLPVYGFWRVVGPT